MKKFVAKLTIYEDRVNYLLPLAAQEMGPLEVQEFDRIKKRLVLRPGGDPRRTGTAVNGFRRYQHTVASPKRFKGTFTMKGRVEKGLVILEAAQFKTPEEVFGA